MYHVPTSVVGVGRGPDTHTCQSPVPGTGDHPPNEVNPRRPENQGIPSRTCYLLSGDARMPRTRDAQGGGRSFSAAGEINRMDFGVCSPVPDGGGLASNKVRIDIEASAVLRKQEQQE